ncbi:transcriptional repressor MprA [Streptomonospora litoralis]|uniref:Transcriptional repressor MprA n=1 Tax=Streptomonospora litoralis TaxID=2498135 RepID=A0A4P6Q2S9_9ACTN|nr:transcriptional repressor MprA [Streptomonospora litoralis]
MPASVGALYEELRVAASLAVRFHAALAAHAGVNITDVSCLGALDKNGPMSPGELADHTGLSRGGAITAVVDRLEKAGFVQRRRDERDRRRVVVELLREGAYARLTETFDALDRSYTEVIADYPEEQRQLLLEFTRRINAQLEERTGALQSGA